MQEVLQTANGIEQLGIIGVMAVICIVKGVIIFKMWGQMRECHKLLLRAVQGKDID